MTDVSRVRQGHWPASSTHASISCRDCRKRKIKCDRSLPTCFVCLKNGQECSYPIGPLKPGPKIGSSRRRMARKKLDTSCHCKQSVSGPLDAQSRQDLCYQSSQSSAPQQGFDYIGLPSPGSEDPPPTGLDSDERTSVPAASTTTNGSSVRVSSLFWILHPSHDVKLHPNSSKRPPMASESMSDQELSLLQGDVCQALGTTLEDIRNLIDLYFSNMTAFSLFHQPTFREKLLHIDSKHDLYALLAAMFSFSSRHQSQPFQATESRQADKDRSLPTSEEFLNLAYEYTSAAFNAYADEPPSLSLLQAVVLTTFAELIKGARARAWRSVGTCVRVAYERQLHLIDADSEAGTSQVETWMVEEQRRTWWAIWEMDVFASTVRRSPTAIDWDTNETFLPVDDEFWFACTPQPSCLLERDPEMRWKALQASKNSSAKAWFIVINSIMRNAQVLSNRARNAAIPRDSSASSRHPPKSSRHARRSVTESTDDLSILNNSLYCFLIALPDHLRHRGGFLAFCDDPTGGKSRQLDSDIYSIHIMAQLARFMIFRENLYWEVEKESPSPHQEDPRLDHLPNTTEGERRWKCYLDTADGIMDVVSSSSPDHFQHINPFLGSTIWLGAAILLVHFRLAASNPLVNRRLAESKFDLLQAVLVKLSNWWGMSTILTDRLSLLQSGLQYPSEGNSSANMAHPHRLPQSRMQHRTSFDWSVTQDPSDPPLVTSEEVGTVESSHGQPANLMDQHRLLGPGDSPRTTDSSAHQKQDRNPILDQDTPSLLFEPRSRVGYDSLGMPDTIGELFSENPATSDPFKNFNMRHQMEFPDFLNDIFPANARI